MISLTQICDPAAIQWFETQRSNRAPVSTSQDSIQLPFQRWFKFKEAFSPQFIVDCASTLGRPVRSCLDPFGGSGTSALTAQFLGMRPTTIEVNPFLGDLIEAKLSTYNLAQLRRDYLQVLNVSKDLHPRCSVILSEGPETLVEPGLNDRWVYSKSVACRILALRQAIECVESRQNRLLLTVVLGSMLVGISNVIVNGKGRKYRRHWKTRQKSPSEVEDVFRSTFFEVFTDVCVYSNRKSREFTLLRGDSRRMINESEAVDFAVFSPPYPNSFDYTDIYNLELWMLGYLKSRNDNSGLRSETLRSHVQIRREYSTDTFGSNSLKSSYNALCAKRKDLWNPHIPEMVCAYFSDMRLILEGVRKKIRKGGKAFLAIGNSMYGGVVVDTETILKDIAFEQGYKKVKSESIRSMRSSAQQGGRRELTESLLILS